MKVKLSDIAAEMGISVAAVSMAINNKSGVSEETRLQVIEVAKRLGYDMKKVNLKKESRDKRFIKLLRIRKHGLVVSDTAFFTSVIEGIDKQAKKMGFEFLISNLTLDANNEQQIADEYHEDVAGMVILCTELMEEDVQGVMNLKCPVVLLDSKFDYNRNTILMNNQKAVRQAVKHLVSKGHRQIGYLKSNTMIYNFNSRFKSFKESMTMHDLVLRDNDVIELTPTIEGAYEDMMPALANRELKDLPTAFVADNDIIALGAINAMQETGIKIPNQISVVGIDDMPFCSLVSPQLTTVHIYTGEIGRQAVKMLVEDIDGESESTRTVMVDTELIQRESVQEITQ